MAWVHGLVGNYCRKTPQSKPGKCRGSMVQSTWLTTHPTLGPIGKARLVGSWVHLRAQVKKIGSPDYGFYVAWVHGLVGNYCRKLPSPNPVSVGVHGPINMVDHTSHTGPHWNGSHSRVVGAFAGTGTKKLARRISDIMWHGSMDWWAIIVEKHPSPNPVSVGVPWSNQHG